MAAAAPKKITAFNEAFTLIQAEAWFANALERLLTFHPGAAGSVPKTTLLELIRTILPGILLNSYYRDAEWASWNAANMRNNAESDKLVTELTQIGSRLSQIMDILMERKLLELPGNKKRKPTNAEKENLSREVTTLKRRRDLINTTLLYGAEGPMARMADRKDVRRRTLRRRQEPFIPQIKAVIDHSTLLTRDEKDEVNLFVDGLMPYFKKKHENMPIMDSSNIYDGLVSSFTDQVRTLDPSVTGSEIVRRGVAKLTANTREAAAAVSHVSGFEDFNSRTNDILFNPESQNEDVIQMINIMKPEMMRRLEKRIEDKVKLNALESRLASLRSLPAKGTKAFTTLEDLVARLEALRTTGDGGAAGGAGRGSYGGGRRRTRRMRRTRR